MQLRLRLQVFCNIQWWVFQDELSINRFLMRFTVVNPIVKHPRPFTPSPIEVYWVYKTSIWDDV